ncbi:type II and III secretion system protein family protein [Sphingorhabdus pulchriflava]|uniref:Type II and III secretion system protein family protein n=1 Tax=Sphingorhabdus pulchriflava TaxID=2292257 RepID=A0A371B299_9SPHN|nr:type II and III secretion system protein family protein [Sphingorhabdus pulchriflava]RDV01680.1 type II and III secretion system protein family protein [Sphingorhabdus pulchriflava]
MAHTAFKIGVALALALTTAPAALAQGFHSSSDAGLHAGQLDVPLNKSQVLTVDRPFGKAMVGNEEIADIMPITNRSLYVLGKKMGTTSLTVYDTNNNVISVVDVAVGPDIVSLRRQLSELIPGETIGARISNDAIVLTGIVSNGPAIDRAVQLAQTYAGDKVVNMMSVGASQQVMLEVRFSEISRQTGKQIGLSGFGFSDGGSFGAAVGNGAGLVPDAGGAGVLRLDSITGSFGVFRKAFDIAGLNIDAVLDALERKGLVKTLAEPTLIALSGETASFLAGGEFPVPVAQNNSSGGGGGGNSGGITIEFKPFGVSLAFTPTVLADGVINLAVEPEVSSIDPTASITVNGLVIPGLQTRRANTVLELRDGESFALAGLIRKDFQTTVRQVPILGSIPIIGSLFRSSGFQKGETELVIVVTPRIVQPVKADQIKLPTDRVQNPNELDLFLMGRTDKATGINPLDPDAKPPEAPKTPKAEGADYDY